MLSRFHLIPKRNGQMDRQTDRFAISISRVRTLKCDNHSLNLEDVLAAETMPVVVTLFGQYKKFTISSHSQLII